MIVRAEDVLYLKRQPATITRQVRQELLVIACTAERGDVRTHLLVAGVSGTLHHLRKRYGSLDLVHLLVRHADDFFQADESGFGHEQAVVLAHTAAVVLRHVIVAQLGRQEEVEPRGLVDALRTYQHQYLVVHTVAQEAGYHRHQPLFQTVVEGVSGFGRIVRQRHRFG